VAGGARRLAIRAGVQLALASARYLLGVAPRVRTELAGWERRARAIEDPQLRELALSKLRDEGLHAEAAAMLATFAPRARRGDVVKAIVALEVLFDFLDGLSERPSPDPLGDGELMFEAFIDAVATGSGAAHEHPHLPPDEDGGYLRALSSAVSVALARLPAAAAVTAPARRTAVRSAQAQIRMHAVPALGAAQLEEWALAQARDAGVEWRELVAGAASSVLVLHALIAAAADPRATAAAASQIAAAYLPTCELLTLLDGLVDYEHDSSAFGLGSPGYLGLDRRPLELADAAAAAARRALTHARALPGGARHVMLLTGVFAYYGSAPGCESELARPVIARARQELEPLISPVLAVMRVWRAARARRPRSVANAEIREPRVLV
jgi:tetraprenyl-beta-curcumene synthase